MLATLLAKDLRRALRNPVPWLIFLALPFLLTGLIGSIFGPRGGGGGLGTVQLALVDEDDSGLGEFLRDALERMRTRDTREEMPFTLRVTVLDRAEAVRRTTLGDFAATVVLPAGFTDGYFSEHGRVSLELIKNPAQAIHPRLIEETLGLLVTVLNGVRDLAGEQLGDVRALIESDDDTLTRLALAGAALVRARDRLEPVRAWLSPPLITYAEETRAAPGESGPRWNLFAFLLAGMAGMFLLYFADHAMRDLYRELRIRTLERFGTLHEGLFAFIAGKAVFAIVAGALGALVLLGGGALVFRFAWNSPGAIAVLTLCYCLAGAGMLGVVAALAGSERRADAFGNIFIMGVAIGGGSMFPPEVFPEFFRTWVMPWMPTAWFTGTVRDLQGAATGPHWSLAALQLAAFGAVAIALAAWLFRRRLARGLHA